MSADKLFVTILGIVLISFIWWFFFGNKNGIERNNNEHH